MNKFTFYYLFALYVYAVLTAQTIWIALITLPLMFYVVKLLVWVYKYENKD